MVTGLQLLLLSWQKLQLSLSSCKLSHSNSKVCNLISKLKEIKLIGGKACKLHCSLSAIWSFAQDYLCPKSTRSWKTYPRHSCNKLLNVMLVKSLMQKNTTRYLFILVIPLTFFPWVPELLDKSILSPNLSTSIYLKMINKFQFYKLKKTLLSAGNWGRTHKWIMKSSKNNSLQELKIKLQLPPPFLLPSQPQEYVLAQLLSEKLEALLFPISQSIKLVI